MRHPDVLREWTDKTARLSIDTILKKKYLILVSKIVVVNCNPQEGHVIRQGWPQKNKNKCIHSGADIEIATLYDTRCDGKLTSGGNVSLLEKMRIISVSTAKPA
jgi:hypothetical protein